MERMILADGDAHEVSCAVLKDGVTSPGVDLLEQLSDRMWPDPKAQVLPDERQVTTKRQFLAQVQHLSDFGELEPGFNRLREGIWELKFWRLRVTFFDTPGDGTYFPKYGEDNHDWSGRNSPLLPEFDEYIRVGHCFGKTTPQTEPKDISRSIRVREEDLAHDCD